MIRARSHRLVPALALGLLWCVALGSAHGEEAEREGAQRARRPALVLGLGGDRDLVVDPGRALHREALERRRFGLPGRDGDERPGRDGDERPGRDGDERLGRDGDERLGRDERGRRDGDARDGRPRLSPIEKVRLDARRIFFASKLDLGEKVGRLVDLVGDRIHHDEEFGLPRDGDPDPARLSEAVATRRGTCRERAFLLDTLLREVGIESRVRYGVLYDKHDHLRRLGAHSWVEARIDGKWRLLDAATEEPVAPLARVRFSVRVGETRRQVRGVEGYDYLYEYTRKAPIESGPIPRDQRSRRAP